RGPTASSRARAAGGRPPSVTPIEQATCPSERATLVVRAAHASAVRSVRWPGCQGTDMAAPGRAGISRPHKVAGPLVVRPPVLHQNLDLGNVGFGHGLDAPGFHHRGDAAPFVEFTRDLAPGVAKPAPGLLRNVQASPLPGEALRDLPAD